MAKPNRLAMRAHLNARFHPGEPESDPLSPCAQQKGKLGIEGCGRGNNLAAKASRDRWLEEKARAVEAINGKGKMRDPDWACTIHGSAKLKLFKERNSVYEEHPTLNQARLEVEII